MKKKEYYKTHSTETKQVEQKINKKNFLLSPNYNKIAVE